MLLRKLLSDPRWQGIGGVLALFAILLSSYTSQTGELALASMGLSSLEYEVPGASIQLTLKGTDTALTAGTERRIGLLHHVRRN